MASLMGMNRFLNQEGVQGMTSAANLAGQRENTKTQLEGAHDASVKTTTGSMAGAGGTIGALAGPSIAAMFSGGGGAAGGATLGGTATSWSGPGALAGAAIGALAGWLMSEFG